VTRHSARGGAFDKSGPSPSAIVGCASTASLLLRGAPGAPRTPRNASHRRLTGSRRQGALWWELGSATCLARLYPRQARTTLARARPSSSRSDSPFSASASWRSNQARWRAASEGRKERAVCGAEFAAATEASSTNSRMAP
jgi:hypothetical protein